MKSRPAHVAKICMVGFEFVCLCVCVFACLCVCVFACLCVCVCVLSTSLR